MMSILKWFTRKTHTPSAKEILHSQHDWVKGYLDGYLNKPIIAVTGEHTPLVIGFLLGTRVIGDGLMPCPVVSDYVSLNTQLAIGRIWPYSDYILQTLCKLTPEQRWLLINTVDSFPRMQIPVAGDEPQEAEPTYEGYIDILNRNHYFEHVLKQKA